MNLSAENLRFILGLKLKRRRLEKGLTLKMLAQKTSLSISYLSEIEKGKKYPKPDKMLMLASALEVPFDELVSLQVHEALTPLKSIFNSTFIQEFPFDLFGFQVEDVFGLIKEAPEKAGALIQTFLEIGQMYDARVEHFLFAALRSYQQMNANYFSELEAVATAYRTARAWPADTPIDAAAMREILIEEHGYQIDETTLAAHPELYNFRSVYLDGHQRRLLINGNMTPSQKAFIYAREIGYQHLGLKERAITSSWLKVESFDQVLNNFKASYFAGALLIDQEALVGELKVFFRRKTWDAEAFLAIMQRFDATPEMFFYRLTELLPEHFGLSEIYFVRFNHDPAHRRFRLTKVFNMSGVAVPQGIWLNEHYCRRWSSMQLLERLAALQDKGTVGPPIAEAQRAHFINAQANYFVISTARPLTLTEGRNSCVSLGFLINDAFKKKVQFWRDPDVLQSEVNLTCERCGLEDCAVRSADPGLFRDQREYALKDEALEQLINEGAQA